MAETKLYSHWRNCEDLIHLRAELFNPGEEKVLTIKEVRKEEVTNNDGSKENKPVVYFEENVLPMVLNVTNCKTIEKLYKTGNIYEWPKKKIQVFVTSTKVGREVMPCLRVRDFEPKTAAPEYRCSVCGKNIDKSLYEKSVAKYGKAYCGKECYETDVNGKQIL